MERRLLLCFALMLSMALTAGNVSENEAWRKAMQFMAAKTGVQQGLKPARVPVRKAPVREWQQPLYVFNAVGGGYVVVSGDDRTEAILGYSKTGSIDADDMPDNMRSFLQGYVDAIRALDGEGETGRQAAEPAQRQSIAPLMETRWNQNYPFNMHCPTYQGKQTYTGCVATAMAQIMACHKWPAATVADLPAYVTGTLGLNMEAIPAGTPIDWDNMAGDYKVSQGDAANEAVATLMLLCGQSVAMDYNLNGSGAPSELVGPALTTYFNYNDSTVRLLNREHYNYADWQTIIYKELAAGRPVFYSGSSSEGGHAFVCDGYDQDDFFHINWGWGGKSDDYFRLRLCNPEEQGIGGGTDNDGFGMDQQCIIGVQPGNGTTMAKGSALGVSTVSMATTVFSRVATSQPFVVRGITARLRNTMVGSGDYDYGVRILDADFNVVTDIYGGSLSLKGYEYATVTLDNVPLRLDNGHYVLQMVSRKKDTARWMLCEQADAAMLHFVVNDLSLIFDYEEKDYNLEVLSYKIEGDLLANSPSIVKMTIRNNGSACRGSVYYYLNPSDSGPSLTYEGLYAAAFIDLARGETTDIQFKFIPKHSGRNSLRVVARLGRETVRLGNDMAVDIKGSPNLELATVKVEGMDSLGVVYGKALNITLGVTNTGESTYDGVLSVRLVRRQENNYIYVNVPTVAWTLTLEPGETKETTLPYDGLTTPMVYMLYVTYTINGEEKVYWGDEVTLQSDTKEPFLTIETAGVPDSYEVEGSTALAVEGSTLTYELTARNTGTATYQGTVDVYLVMYEESEGQWYFTDEPTPWQLTLEPGESVKESFTWDNLNIGTLYACYLQYPLNGKTLPKWCTHVRMVEPTGIEPVAATAAAQQQAYDLQGRRLGEKGQKSLARGIYIIGGKKVVRP